MTQYNNQTRPDRRRTSSGYRRDNGKSGFLSVLLFYVLPFIVINGIIFLLVTARPKAEITIGESSDFISTTMELKVKSLLPIKTMEVSLDSTPIELTKTGGSTYKTTLKNNGTLEVKLTGFNKMKSVSYETVNVLDDTPPAVKDNVLDNGILSFRLEDTQSGVDYSSITASDEDNTDILPLSIDRSTGLVTFEIKKENITITAKDKIGNELHVTFTPQGDSFEDAEMKNEEAAENGDTADTNTSLETDAEDETKETKSVSDTKSTNDTKSTSVTKSTNNTKSTNSTKSSKESVKSTDTTKSTSKSNTGKKK
ncbi:hypothetical protein BXY41_101514 [Lacrimispora xylanisolvens]|uniref:Uncharacterized protein n=1 Tax=Lacrimispora xylanisolvens TaxID=384636 RepID=A0A2S6HZG1_9FIRM|nr:hypothetical protein [Hungatella xylanolytica]PPK83450.1 hypothetical protein BXY41_101514 [Hungatella xylanolytica]